MRASSMQSVNASDEALLGCSTTNAIRLLSSTRDSEALQVRLEHVHTPFVTRIRSLRASPFCQSLSFVCHVHLSGPILWTSVNLR